MNTLVRIASIALVSAAALQAQATPTGRQADGGRYVATSVMTPHSSRSVLRRRMEQDCSALERNPDDPALACEAVRCATGLSPAWSMCPSGERRSPVAQ